MTSSTRDQRLQELDEIIERKQDELDILIHEQGLLREEDHIEQLPSTDCKKIRYAHRPINPDRILKRWLDETVKTIRLMDEFSEKTRNKDKVIFKYDHLIIEWNGEMTYVEIEGDRYEIFYIIERPIQTERLRNSWVPLQRILMTDLKKKETQKLDRYAKEELRRYIDKNGKPDPNDRTEIWFEYAYGLKAQSSKNRTGYGDEWYGDRLISVGTRYGETDIYWITGVLATRMKY